MSGKVRTTIDAKAYALLAEMAAAEAVTPRQYLEALLHYAGSCHQRPGSWEANAPFRFRSYDNRCEEGLFADRWF